MKDNVTMKINLKTMLWRIILQMGLLAAGITILSEMLRTGKCTPEKSYPVMNGICWLSAVIGTIIGSVNHKEKILLTSMIPCGAVAVGLILFTVMMGETVSIRQMGFGICGIAGGVCGAILLSGIKGKNYHKKRSYR